MSPMSPAAQEFEAAKAVRRRLAAISVGATRPDARAKWHRSRAGAALRREIEAR